MAIETGGFRFTPTEARLAQVLAPVQLQFVSGQSLVGDPGIRQWAELMSEANRTRAASEIAAAKIAAEASMQGTENLIAGATSGLGSITGAIEKLLDRKYSEEEADKKFARDIAVARIKASMNEEMSPEEALDYELKQLELREKKRQQAWSEWPEGEEPPAPLSTIGEEDLPALAEPNLDILPEDVPLEPMPQEQLEDEETSIEPPLPEEAPSGGRYTMVTFPDGSTQIKDRATGKLIGQRTPPPTEEGEIPEGMVPESVTITKDGQRVTYKTPEEAKTVSEAPEVPEGMRLKGAKSSDGKMSYEYELDTSDEDVQQELSMAKSNMDQANRIIQDIDLAIKIAKESKFPLPAAGKFSEWVDKLPFTTGASDLRRIVNNISADVAFESLAKMRRESKTGGALGSVSEKELSLLQAAEGSIDPSLSPKLFIANMNRIKEARKELIEMWGSKLEKITTKNPEAGMKAPGSEEDGSKAIESQIKNLRSDIINYPSGSPERQAILKQISDLTSQYVRMTGRTPSYR